MKLNNIPSIDLQLLNKFTKLFSETTLYQDYNHEITETMDLILIERNRKGLPLSLESGKKVVLTVRNFDLSIFSNVELKEILRVLDILVSDEKYDLLRTEITKRLSDQSNISIIG